MLKTLLFCLNAETGRRYDKDVEILDRRGGSFGEEVGLYIGVALAMDNQDAVAMFINEWEILATTISICLSIIPKLVNA